MMSISRREFVKISLSAAAILLARQNRGESLRLRKEIGTLTAAELATFRAGVGAMQALARDNFLSWDYQRAVHDIPAATVNQPDPPGIASYWRRCEHHTPHFFDWHRWELLYWEEICRQLCGNIAFTLPYWDYFSNGYLPEAFRPTASGQTNVLAHARQPDLNNGTAQLNTIAATSNWPAISPTGMDETDFFSFDGLFEVNPHDLVHGIIGFDMGSILTAALDPVFYVHHANVDRYWAGWLEQGNGRSNPGGSWAATNFNFQTVAGPKTPSAGAAGTPEQLGYTYKPSTPRIDMTKIAGILKLLRELQRQFKFPKVKQLPVPPHPPPPGPGPDPGPWQTLVALEGIRLDGNPTVIRPPTAGAAARTLEQLLRADTDFALVLHNIRATKFAEQGGFVYQIFLVSSEKALAQGKTKEAAEVGSFSSFSVSVVEHHDTEKQGTAPQLVIPIGRSTRMLLAKSLKGDPAFVFVRRGLISGGKEMQSNMNETLFTFDELRLEARTRAAK